MSFAATPVLRRARGFRRPDRHGTFVNQEELSPTINQRGNVMGVLISILITFLVVILVLYLIGMLPIDARAKQIARIVVIIIGVISLLRYLAVF